MEDKQMYFMQMAVELSLKGMESDKGGPFGCVIVKDGEVIGKGYNAVLETNDPTAHAEIVAIRDACNYLGDFQLIGCEVYTSCEPCPMCMGAIYWARPDRVFYANTKEDAAEAGFDDHFIYRELEIPPDSRKIPFIQIQQEDAYEVFKKWILKENKTLY